MAKTTESGASLRMQGAVLRWLTPLSIGVSATVSGAQISPTTAFVSACIAAPIGFVIGQWTAAWCDAAAEALDCEHEILVALNAMGNRLGPQLADQHSKTFELVRMIGEQMVDANTRSTELLRILAMNTDSLTRLESNERPANANQR